MVAKFCSNAANLWTPPTNFHCWRPHRVKFGRALVDFDQHWAMSVKLSSPNSATFRRFRRNLDQIRLDLGDACPTRPAVCHMGSGFCQTLPSSARFVAEFGAALATFYFLALSVELATSPASTWPTLAVFGRPRPDLARIWPNAGDFGRRWAKLSIISCERRVQPKTLEQFSEAPDVSAAPSPPLWAYLVLLYLRIGMNWSACLPRCISKSGSVFLLLCRFWLVRRRKTCFFGSCCRCQCRC